MIKPADRRAAFAAGCMLVAGVVMLALGVIALLVQVPLTVAGLFLTMAVPCGIVAVSLGNIAMRGRQPAPGLETVSEAAPAE